MLDHLFRNCGSGDTTDRLAGTGATAALPVSNSVFRLVGVVGMGGAEFLAHFRVGFGTSIFVADENTDRRSEGLSFKRTGENFSLVGFVSRRCDLTLSGATPVEVDLNIFYLQGDLRRTSVHDHTYPSAVGFTPRGKPK